MPPRTKRRANNSTITSQPHLQPNASAQISDFDTGLESDIAPAPIDPDSLAPPEPSRTNEELNLAVLRRHYPSITNILSIAPYAVIYIFSTTAQGWEKSGVEGTLFVCSLESINGGERYCVVVLNRRGLENFDIELRKAGDVEVADDYIIIQGDMDAQHNNGNTLQGSPVIYGLWIFAEANSSTASTRAINARVIQDCAARAEESGMSTASASNNSQFQTDGVANYEASFNDSLGPPDMQQLFSNEEINNLQRVLNPTENAGHIVTNQSHDILGDLFRRAAQARDSAQ